MLAPPSELVRGGRSSSLQVSQCGMRLCAVWVCVALVCMRACVRSEGKSADITWTAGCIAIRVISLQTYLGAEQTSLRLTSAAAAAQDATLASSMSAAERAYTFDCDRSGALSQTAWPLTLLAQHFHPHVASTATAALRRSLLLPCDRADAVFRAYDPSSGVFNPPPPAPQPHPFAARLAASSAGPRSGGDAAPQSSAALRKQQRQARRPCFIAPRPAASFIAAQLSAEQEKESSEQAHDAELAAVCEAHCAAAQKRLAARCGSVLEGVRGLMLRPEPQKTSHG
jgi:hypothetical protein